MNETTLLFIAGTRPEALKLAPVIRQMRQPGSLFTPKICFSGQHVEILNTVLGDLDVAPDVDFRTACENRTLSGHLAALLNAVDDAVEQTKPDAVVVQGDTNTVLAGGLVGHHRQLPVFHVEAGLRTCDPMRPFPEEMNRRLVGRLASLHFAPTARARDNLLAEGIDPETIEVTGNTGIDALRIYASEPSPEADEILARTRPGARRMLVTLHRRENSDFVSEVTAAVQRVATSHPDVDILWILHMNGMRARIEAALRAHPRVLLLEPQSYRTFVHLMKGAHIILSDSGGVQEEAPTLGKPVLVLRTETERPEAVEAGNAWVVGCSAFDIVRACRRLLQNPAVYERMSQPRHPFGDGHASERIARAISRFFYAPVIAHPTLRPSQRAV